MNTKGTSLGSITMIMVFGVMCLTAFFIFAMEGANKYGVTIDSGFQTSFDVINSTSENLSSNAQLLGLNTEQTTDGEESTDFRLPKTIWAALKVPYTVIKSAVSIISEFRKSIPIPNYVILAIFSGLLFMLGFLLIAAYLRKENI